MPGWYIHLDVARRAISNLATVAGGAAAFGAPGPAAADLTTIAQNNSAYAALGAIGPDIFFLLPDFKPPFGYGLWGASKKALDLYTWWDLNFLLPYEDYLEPAIDNVHDLRNYITGGLYDQVASIHQEAHQHIRNEAIIIMGTSSYDLFGLMGSGPQSAYDEQTFFWSDMLHYRKTFEFARYLWAKANTVADLPTQAKFKAFALGYMSHLATDVTGHCFVNEKSGGPFRLHWQRHHVVENHMDAQVYDNEFGGGSNYQMFSCSALHLWLRFKDDGSSHLNIFVNPARRV